MKTSKFNLLDKLIARWRVNKITQYIGYNETILDFGCGFQAYFLKQVSGKIRKGTGLDYEVADKHIGSNIELIRYNFTNRLPFKNKSFDKVSMLAVAEHFSPDQLLVLLKEINRVLVIDGQLILTTPTPASEKVLELLANNLHLISKAEIADHKKYYAKNDLARLSAESGFSVEKYSLFQFGLNSLSILRKLKNPSRKAAG